MRILQISDTHLGAKLNARGPAGWQRADDHHAALEHALGPALREEVDLVVHAGDVFDRSLPPRRDVLRAGALFLEVARRVPVLGIAGNHDRRGIQRWLPHRSLRFVDRAEAVEVRGLRVGLLPFRREAAAFAADAAGLGPVDLLVCHAAFDGSRVPGFTFREGRHADTVGAKHLPRDLRWVASGHIHPRQSLRLGDATVVHGGSTERTAFSEAPQVKGAVLWDFAGDVRWRFVDHPTRPMHVGDAPPAPGALVRCEPGGERAVREAGGIAVVRAAR
ncbi:MAG: metallophosphoesterase [Alphaproteobacteria bacterium]|nr:metallophosphoesterase [Alphaproteobacteria bacterium]